MKLFKLLFFIVIFSASLAYADEGKEASYEVSAKIIGGEDTEIEDWPWMATVRILMSDGYYRCAGTLIHPKWLLTAAHCMYDEKRERWVNSSALEIVSGSNDFSNSSDIIAVKTYIRHPDFNSNTQDSDIALLELEKEINQETLDLYTGNSSLAGEDGTILGWGITIAEDENSDTDILQKASVPIISNETCLKSYPNEITENMLCAGYSYGGVDSCLGDSGGPIVVYEKGAWRHAGIISWGNGCGVPGYYGVHTRTSKFIDFITISIEDDDDSGIGVSAESGGGGCFINSAGKK